MADRGRVAVLGLGVSGLTALKNFLEQGFDAVAFERNEYVGGLWQYNPDPKQTTVLKVTRTNVTKQMSSYHDHPFPNDVPDYPTGDHICDYMRSYANHFSLMKHCHLGVTVLRIERASPSGPVKWAIKFRDKAGERVEVFDRVLVTTGPFERPFLPMIEGVDDFEGRVIHSQAYKGPDPFVGKRVVVVGLGNTGCDIAVELCGSAKEVYLSHRAGGRVLKRYPKGSKPFDHSLSRRRMALTSRIARNFPSLADKFSNRMFLKLYPDYKEEWKLLPAPPFSHSPAAFNEDVVNRLVSGDIINLSGIKRFTSTGIITDEQGEIKVDIVIFATGAYFDYSILSDEANPTRSSTPRPEWEKSEYRNDLEYPRLYQTLFSTRFPDSLAFIGPCRSFSFAAFSNSDLAAQAIAQVWQGSYPLPSQTEMEKWCDDNYERTLRQLKVWRVSRTGTDPVGLEKWLNEVSGNGVNDALGWGWEGWSFWWKERELYGLIVGGINTPFLYRLFEGRKGSRKRFEGAREAIYRANGIVPR